MNRPVAKGVGTLLGAAQAEADVLMLRRAFVETADYQALLHTSDFNYVVGRRGTGKSAIFQRLHEDFAKDTTVVLLVDQPQDFEMLALQALLRPITEDYRTLRPITRLLWTTHFLLEATKAATRHYRFAKARHARFLSEYVAKYSLQNATSGAAHCAHTLKSIRNDNVPAQEIPGVIASRYEVTSLTDALREMLHDLGLRVIAMYDRLDEAWVPEVGPVSILGGLAKTAADYRERQFPIYPILFIRDNMFRALAQFDDDFTRHIEAHALRLQWDEESLLHLISARLRVVLDMNAIENDVKVWNRFARSDLQGRPGFKRCLKYTLYRPRDILVLLNAARANSLRDNRDGIVEPDIERSALSISQNRLEDLCKEYDKVLPGLRLFVSTFRGQAAARPVREVVHQLEECARTNDYSETGAGDLVLFESGGEMFSALYSVGFIGVRDDASGSYVFCHDGTMAALVSLPGTRETLVHPCYWKALDAAISEEATESVIQVNDEYAVPRTDESVALRFQRLGRLPEELAGIGEGHTGSKAFEAWVLRAIRVLFSGSLANIELKPNPGNALSQRDIVATNTARTSLWKRVHEDYETRQVAFECKNYRELTPEDFRQVLDYSVGEYGRFSVVVRRGENGALTETEKERTKATFYDHKRLVVIVPVPLLALSIRKLRSPKKYDYAEFTMSRHLDYIVRSVLSMTHTPRYRKKRRK